MATKTDAPVSLRPMSLRPGGGSSKNPFERFAKGAGAFAVKAQVSSQLSLSGVGSTLDADGPVLDRKEDDFTSYDDGFHVILYLFGYCHAYMRAFMPFGPYLFGVMGLHLCIQAADVPLFEEEKKKPRSEVKVYSLQQLEAQQEVCMPEHCSCMQRSAP